MRTHQNSVTIVFVAIVFGATVFALAGCVPNQQYRTSFKLSSDPSAQKDPKAVIETHQNYKLGFVEFDDQGAPWDDRQRIAVEEMIRTEARLPAVNGTLPQGIILVTFVHGWKDNAAYDNDGVQAFRQILTRLDAGEKAEAAGDAQTKPRAARKVVGVYVGWRGLSAAWEPFKELSFWDRMEIAHKVGGYGGLTRILTDLENIQKDSLTTLQPHAPRTELIIIGHSMGAAAIYSAVSQIITARFVNSVALPMNQQKLLKPLGDQIILLNPAFEAVRHDDLYRMAVAVKSYPKEQRPVLSIFTSKGDWATHYVFPLGRFFPSLFDSTRSQSQWRADVDAVGWFPDFVTHNLHYAPNVSPAASPGKESGISEAGQLKKSVSEVNVQRKRWHPGKHPPIRFEFDQFVLDPVHYTPGDPILIVSMDQSIMHDHTDIADPVLTNFIRDYIQFCQPDVSDKQQ
jgi:hypothetical protein